MHARPRAVGDQRPDRELRTPAPPSIGIPAGCGRGHSFCRAARLHAASLAQTAARVSCYARCPPPGAPTSSPRFTRPGGRARHDTRCGERARYRARWLTRSGERAVASRSWMRTIIDARDPGSAMRAILDPPDPECARSPMPGARALSRTVVDAGRERAVLKPASRVREATSSLAGERTVRDRTAAQHTPAKECVRPHGGARNRCRSFAALRTTVR